MEVALMKAVPIHHQPAQDWIEVLDIALDAIAEPG
jgi:hypothetical protein